MDILKKKLSIIVFSKDRPLQMQAYLESLAFFTKSVALNITVIYKSNPEISYQGLIDHFKDPKITGRRTGKTKRKSAHKKQ